MNVQPFEKAPRWWPPKLSPFWIGVWRPFRRRKQLREQRLIDIEVRGLDNLRRASESGRGVMITPNHPGHADGYVIYHAADRHGCPFYMIAAWQVFGMSGWLQSHILRHHGCFSIDRENTDIRAIKQATSVLCEGRNPLVIFPEGEVYHLSERITPFREGAAAIAMTAAKRAKQPVLCVPCAIKYFYAKDPTPELAGVMDALEQRILWRPRPDMPLPDRIYRFGGAMLALKEMEYLGHAQEGALSERIASLTNEVLRGLEQRHDVNGQGMTIPERVKTLRQRSIKLMESETEDEARRQIERNLDDLFMVVQLFSYPGDYVSEHPSIERIAETIDKFEEDVLGAPTATIRGARRAVISFGEPIEVEHTRDRKAAIPALTKSLEKRVQALLDEISPPSS